MRCVFGMVIFMSMYGVLASYMYNRYHSSFMTDYPQVFWKNLIVALPLQIIVMGLIVRFLFTTYVKTNKHKDVPTVE